MPQAQNTDTDFERQFSQMAIIGVQDKAPSLMEYLVGFQVLKASEDHQHASGVFGCHVGSQWLYLPVFFHNGELMGQEIMYLKDQDIFLPLEENWINWVLQRKPMTLGEPSTTPRQQIFSNPADFTQLLYSPVTRTKIAGVLPCFRAGNLEKAFAPFLKAAAESIQILAGKSERHQKAAAALDLRAVLPELPVPMVVRFLNTMVKEAAVGDWVLQHYRLEDLSQTVRSIKQADAIINGRRVRGDARQIFLDFLEEQRPENMREVKSAAVRTIDAGVGASEGKTTKVQILSADHLSAGDGLGLSDAEKEKLFAGEYVVKDPGEESTRRSVIRAELPQSLSSINTTGLWRSVDADTDKPVNVLVYPVLQRNYDPSSDSGSCCSPCAFSDHEELLVVCPEERKVSSVYNSRRRTRVGDSIGASLSAGALAADDYIQKLPKVADVTRGQHCVLITPQGRALGPVRILRVHRTESGSVDIAYDRNTYEETISDRDLEYARRIIVPKRDVKSGWVGEVLYLDGETRVVAVDRKRELHLCKTLELFTRLMVDGQLGKLRILNLSDGEMLTEWAGKETKTKGVAQTAEKAANDLSLSGADALSLVREAKARGHVTAWLTAKQADAGAGTSAIGEQQRHQDAVLGTSVIEPQTELVLQRAMQSRNPGAIPASDPRLQEAYPAMVGFAQQAAAAGQKEIMDPGVLAAMIDSTDNDQLISRYLKNLYLGLDAAGRAFFLFCAHPDYFQERYGDEQNKELAGAMKNQINGLGDLIFSLQQRDSGRQGTNNRVDLGNAAAGA